MKLETGYRKLMRHRKRWEILIKPIPACGYEIRITATWRGGELPYPFGNMYFIRGIGLGNAMAHMADKLDRVERAMHLYHEMLDVIRSANSTR